MKPTMAVRGISRGYVEEEIHPLDQCEGKVNRDGDQVPCELPKAYRIEVERRTYDSRPTETWAHPALSSWIGREVCWYHARLAGLHAERWDLPLRVRRIRD